MRDAFINSVTTLSRDGRVMVPVGKSRTAMRVRGERTGKFMEHGGLFRSWRFIGLIVTRAKRRDDDRARARARPKLLPRKNVFTRETERSPSKTSRGDEERKFPGQGTETSMTAVKTPKSRDGREFTEARFMDYRSSARDLSDKPNAGLLRGFRQKRNCALDENTLYGVRGREEKRL